MTNDALVHGDATSDVIRGGAFAGRGARDVRRARRPNRRRSARSRRSSAERLPSAFFGNCDHDLLPAGGVGCCCTPSSYLASQKFFHDNGIKLTISDLRFMRFIEHHRSSGVRSCSRGGRVSIEELAA